MWRWWVEYPFNLFLWYSVLSFYHYNVYTYLPQNSIIFFEQWYLTDCHFAYSSILIIDKKWKSYLMNKWKWNEYEEFRNVYTPVQIHSQSHTFLIFSERLKIWNKLGNHCIYSEKLHLIENSVKHDDVCLW